MDKRAESAQVNSSYTVFFFFTTIGLSFFFSESFGDKNNVAWFVALGYALLIYFVWDLIKQLYSPGQSIILYCLTFSVVPFILSMTIGNDYPITGIVTWIIAMPIARLFEVGYEYAFKSIAPKHIIKRLLTVDNAIDKSLVELNMKYESHFNYKSIILAAAIIVTYSALSIWLVRGLS